MSAGVALALADGGVATVDLEDYARLARFVWHRDRNGYPFSRRVRQGKGKRVYLHRAVLRTRSRRYVDHMDGNPLNATRDNLRLATNSQNQANRRKVQGRVPIKGVTLHRGTGKYQAQLKHRGRTQYLGLHGDPVAAGVAYWQRAREVFGPFAWTNLPPETLEAYERAKVAA